MGERESARLQSEILPVRLRLAALCLCSSMEEYFSCKEKTTGRYRPEAPSGCGKVVIRDIWNIENARSIRAIQTVYRAPEPKNMPKP